jgi:hypothetical protein
VSLVDILEERFGDPALIDELRTLDKVVDQKRSNAVRRSILVAKEHVEAFDVFLAYNARDAGPVEAIAHALRQRGLNPWLDRWNLPPGRRFAEEIEHILLQTRAVAVFVGERGAGPWERVELYAALQLFVDRKRPLIPVLLPAAAMEPPLPLFLQQFGWVRFDGSVTDAKALDNLQWGITGSRPENYDAHGMVVRA